MREILSESTTRPDPFQVRRPLVPRDPSNVRMFLGWGPKL